MAVARVLFAIDLVGLTEDLPGDAIVITGRVLRRVGVHLRAVDRDHPDLDHPGPCAQPEHAAEEVGDRVLVALAKPGDGGVIGDLVGRDHPKRDVFYAGPLDAPRRALPARVRVHQQRDHHRRIVRRPPVTIGPIGVIERRELELFNTCQDEPRKVILRQPIAQARRHQQDLLTLA